MQAKTKIIPKVVQAELADFLANGWCLTLQSIFIETLCYELVHKRNGNTATITYNFKTCKYRVFLNKHERKEELIK